MSDELNKEKVLERFMKEFFPYKEFKQMGVFTKEMRGDYKAQAERICWIFGYKTVYEYGATEIRCHISYGDSVSGMGSERPLHVDDKGKLQEEPFITVFPSIYE